MGVFVFNLNFFKVLPLSLLLFLISCGAHFPLDIAPNPAIHGFHQIEFDIEQEGVTRKELGIANIILRQKSDLSKVTITIHSIYNGTLYLLSNACGVDLTISFKGKTTFNLSNLLTFKEKCSIRVTSITDQIKGKEHNIIETGILKINLIPDRNSVAEINYDLNNKEYSFKGQCSLQRSEGDLSNQEHFTVKTKLKEGGLYRIIGCGYESEGSFDKSSFTVYLRELYKKNIISKKDTCDFEINIIPYEQPFSYLARLSISVYENKVVKLEPLDWKINKKLGRIYITATGKEYVIVCSINDSYEIKKSKNKKVECKDKYSSNKIYWLRSITANGRKSVIAVKNGQVIWKE